MTNQRVYPRELLRDRLRDYELEPPELLRELVAKWRERHPEAAMESSAAPKPLDLVRRRLPEERPDAADEHWANDTYYVTLRRHAKDPVFGRREGMVQLGIAAHDGTARHDWREFQAIKNQLAGAECEAFELYPAESRLLDPSNYYTLWCFPGLKRLKVGYMGRDVRRSDEALAPQRAFPDESAARPSSGGRDGEAG